LRATTAPGPFLSQRDQKDQSDEKDEVTEDLHAARFWPALVELSQ